MSAVGTNRGADGAPGPTGPAGTPGGPPGPTGADGAQGVAGVNATGSVIGDTSLFNILSLPKMLKGGLKQNYNTDAIFTGNYNLAHNQAPFSGGRGFTSATSTQLSPLGEPYETYTVSSADNAYTLRLDSSGSNFFNPVTGKSYQFAFLMRGVGASVGKKVTAGFYKPARTESIFTLTEDWTLFTTGTEINDAGIFNFYLHSTGRAATMAVGEQFQIAGYYVLQID